MIRPLMALPPTAVRYRKYAFYPFMAIAILPMAIVSYAVFTSRPSWSLYASYAFILLVVFFIFRRLVLMTRSTTPVLVFESHALTINSRKPRTIPWSSITQWKIRNHKANYKLVIRTQSRKTSVEITWLELPAKEIGRLMESYIRACGSTVSANR